MAHARLTAIVRAGAWVTSGAMLLACGGPPAARSATEAAPPTPKDDGYAAEDSAWGRFHSERFRLTLPLPDGRAWSIDDHRSAELVAKHTATSSRLALRTTEEPGLVNRARCEQRARSLGLVPDEALTTVEDQVYAGPDAYDSRVWVALGAPDAGGAVEGHVFVFGAFLRRCLLFHLTTRVPSPTETERLAARLAIATARIVKGITLDPLRTTDGATTERDRPGIRR